LLKPDLFFLAFSLLNSLNGKILYAGIFMSLFLLSILSLLSIEILKKGNYTGSRFKGSRLESDED